MQHTTWWKWLTVCSLTGSCLYANWKYVLKKSKYRLFWQRYARPKFCSKTFNWATRNSKSFACCIAGQNSIYGLEVSSHCLLSLLLKRFFLCLDKYSLPVQNETPLFDRSNQTSSLSVALTNYSTTYPKSVTTLLYLICLLIPQLLLQTQPQLTTDLISISMKNGMIGSLHL